MGVHGLWKLIEPAGKPVPVETLENKVVAVDVSIWLHQLVKGYQDAGGGSVANAHLLGLFHRICKLLFYKIKPVFVFDGGVPVLKKQTIAARRSQRNKADETAAKLREQILKNLIQQRAVGHASGTNGPAASLPTHLLSQREGDMFELPPVPSTSTEVKVEKTEDSDEDEFEYKPLLSAHQLQRVDVNSEEFKALPPDMRHDILSELKESRKQNSWRQIAEMPENLDDFSDFQLGRLMKRRNIQVALEEAGKEMGGRTLSLGEMEKMFEEDGIITDTEMTQRIASDSSTRFVYIPGGKIPAGMLLNEPGPSTSKKDDYEEDVKEPAVPLTKSEEELEVLKMIEEIEDEFSGESDIECISVKSEIQEPKKVVDISDDELTQAEIYKILQESKKASSVSGQSSSYGAAKQDENPLSSVESELSTMFSGGDMKPKDDIDKKVKLEAKCDDDVLAVDVPNANFSSKLKGLESKSKEKMDLKQNIPHQKTNVTEKKNNKNISKKTESSHSLLKSPKHEIVSPKKERLSVEMLESGSCSNESEENILTTSQIDDMERKRNARKVESETGRSIYFASPTKEVFSPKKEKASVEVSESGSSSDEFVEVEEQDEMNLMYQKCKLDEFVQESISKKKEKPCFEIVIEPSKCEVDSLFADVFTSSVPLDTGSVPLDTNSVPLDTSNVPLDTSNVPSVTSSVPLGTSSVPLDTKSVPLDTSSVPLDTTNVSLDTRNVPLDTNSVSLDTSNVPLDTNSGLLDTSNVPLEKAYSVTVVEKFRESEDLSNILSKPNLTSNDTSDLESILKSKLASIAVALESKKSKRRLDEISKLNCVKMDQVNKETPVQNVKINEVSATLPSENEEVENDKTSDESVGKEREDVSQIPDDVETCNLNAENVASNVSQTGGDSVQDDEDSVLISEYTESLYKQSTADSDLNESAEDLPQKDVPRQIDPEALKNLQNELEIEQDKLLIERGRQERLASNITEQMNTEAQELLKIFGIPFIIAPMEAEAQCAFLDSAMLTEGTITDDSDIWLFGGRKVYKNFFDQKKHVLLFRNVEITHYFKLSRAQLIQLALLVGSDYTTGLKGVGPVTAMEILSFFKESTEEEENKRVILSGLEKFKEWLKKPENIRAQCVFANKVKNLSVHEGFPNPAVVDAYLNPEVDNSTEGFSWGPPDLKSLEDFVCSKFGWTKSKLDNFMNPVLKKISERTNQSSIDRYFQALPKISGERATVSKRVKRAIDQLSGETEVDEPLPSTSKQRRKMPKRDNTTSSNEGVTAEATTTAETTTAETTTTVGTTATAGTTTTAGTAAIAGTAATAGTTATARITATGETSATAQTMRTPQTMRAMETIETVGPTPFDKRRKAVASKNPGAARSSNKKNTEPQNLHLPSTSLLPEDEDDIGEKSKSEVIPQREKDNIEKLKRKLKAVELFNASKKNSRGKRRKTNMRRKGKIENESYLSESSDSD